MFDAYAALRKLESEPATPAILATIAILTPDERPKIAEIAEIAGGHVQNQENTPLTKTSDKPKDLPYGRSTAGSPETWTGKIVSLDEWRRLSGWDRHGSTGQMWSGLSRKWEAET